MRDWPCRSAPFARHPKTHKHSPVLRTAPKLLSLPEPAWFFKKILKKLPTQPSEYPGSSGSLQEAVGRRKRIPDLYPNHYVEPWRLVPASPRPHDPRWACLHPLGWRISSVAKMRRHTNVTAILETRGKTKEWHVPENALMPFSGGGAESSDGVDRKAGTAHQSRARVPHPCLCRNGGGRSSGRRCQKRGTIENTDQRSN
jgi:hypothetical protein